jgi:hypothetical protein
MPTDDSLYAPQNLGGVLARSSRASGGDSIPMVVQFGYDRHNSEGYLRNAGLSI